MRNTDWRYLENGLPIPAENGYCDQPSVVVTPGGRWVAVITCGTGREGARGETAAVLLSDDEGRTWRRNGTLESPEWESSYAAAAIAENGRIAAVYDYNLDHLAAGECGIRRVDMGGALCFRFSDDEGETWSERRVIPVRDFAIDRKYPSFAADGRRYRMFWNVSKPFFVGNDFYCALTKPFYGSFFPEGHPFRGREEMVGALLRCRGLAENADGEWETLPEGDAGISGPPGGGPVCEEFCFVRLSDGTLFGIARTADGYPSCAISRDGGRTFGESFFPRYADGRRVKTSRAANFIWPLGEGRYLYWFHNVHRPGYGSRNPAWCVPLREVRAPEGMTLSFGEPEILLYHRSEYFSISYPDLFRSGGRYFLSETQKQTARIHPVPQSFLDALFSEKAAPIPDVPAWSTETGGGIPAAALSEQDQDVRADWRNCSPPGFTLVLALKPLAGPESLLEAYSPVSGGIRAFVSADGFPEIRISGVSAEVRLCGSTCLLDGKPHRIACIFDSRALCAWLVTDGHMDDGGERFACGWRWIPEQMQSVGGCARPEAGPSVLRAAVYPRAVLSAEAAADFRAGLREPPCGEKKQPAADFLPPPAEKDP